MTAPLCGAFVAMPSTYNVSRSGCSHKHRQISAVLSAGVLGSSKLLHPAHDLLLSSVQEQISLISFTLHSTFCMSFWSVNLVYLSVWTLAFLQIGPKEHHTKPMCCMGCLSFAQPELLSHQQGLGQAPECEMRLAWTAMLFR